MSTLRDQYVKSVKKDEKRVQHYDSASPKQRLVMLREAGLLTKLQARAVATRINDAQKEGRDPEKALDMALAVFESGDLKVGAPDPKAKENLPSLEDIREAHPGASKKQLLLELRNAGSIAPLQTKAAARNMTKGMSIEQALAEAGCEHVLDTVPAPEAEDEDADPTPDADEATGQEESEPEKEEEKEPELADEDKAPRTPDQDRKAKASRTLEDILDQPIEDEDGEGVKKDIAGIKSKAAMVQLVVFETFGKTRKTLIPELRDRAKELGATDDEIDQAIKIARQQHEGTTPEDAYKE